MSDELEMYCIDGMMSINGQVGLPCPHCSKAVERYLLENTGTITTTGSTADAQPNDRITELEKALTLRECIECRQPAFEISPINQSEGFCWNCHKLLTIEALLPGETK